MSCKEIILLVSAYLYLLTFRYKIVENIGENTEKPTIIVLGRGHLLGIKIGSFHFVILI